MSKIFASECRKNSLFFFGAILFLQLFFTQKIETGNQLKKNSVFPVLHHSLSEVKERWRIYQSGFQGNPYLERPQLNYPYQPGKLNPEFISSGIKMVRFVRFLAGVSEEVQPDDEMNRDAQYGAVLMAVKGTIGHFLLPPQDMQPEFYTRARQSLRSSNLFYFYGSSCSLKQAIYHWCADSDETNSRRLGHRQLIFHPQLQRTAFGFADKQRNGLQEFFVTMQIFPLAAKPAFCPEFIFWPAPGYFPADLFAADHVWSVSVRKKNFSVPPEKITVTLERLNDYRVWFFQKAGNDLQENFFNLTTDLVEGYDCLSFRPQDLATAENNLFQVTISGIEDRNKKPVPISYYVYFFALSEQMVAMSRNECLNNEERSK